jgi:hypothetical protein
VAFFFLISSQFTSVSAGQNSGEPSPMSLAPGSEEVESQLSYTGTNEEIICWWLG